MEKALWFGRFGTIDYKKGYNVKDDNVPIKGFKERKRNCHEGQQQIGLLSKHHMEKTFITLET